MLSMKTLRVAIVAMGSALLLGPGFAAATVQQLDARGGPDAVAYAAETLTAMKDATVANDERMNDFVGVAPDNVIAQGRTTHYALVSPDHPVHVLVVEPSRKIEDETVYVRLDLEGGMVFNGEDVSLNQDQIERGDDGEITTDLGDVMADSSTDAVDQTAGGSAGDSYVVFRYAAEAMGETIILANESLWFRIDHALAVPMGTGAYGATISAYTSADDAVDGVGAVSSISGGGTIIRVVSGLDASVTAGDALEASVAQGFRYFNPGRTAQGRLGLFQAIAAPMGVYSASDGLPAVDSDIISTKMGSVTVSVEGDLSIGAFSVVAYNAAVEAAAEEGNIPAVLAMDAMYNACPTGPAEVDEDPMNDDMGTLLNPDDPEAAVTTVGTESLGAGMYGLCVNVEPTGPMSSMNAIPEGEYTATVSVLSPGADDPWKRRAARSVPLHVTAHR